MLRTTIPIKIAIPKLRRVPIKIYSVSFLSLDSLRSPNLITDFAANKNPIASHLPNITNVKTKSLSKIPMYLPALSKD